ncbi:MAG: hypothetical protein A2033_13785 [Bacteroidetes bacterium GWA2_31_9]|nr:MAG: hypothetical protein A2033_13785 [Bacteroidetes bacterium GWA2_31_9]
MKTFLIFFITIFLFENTFAQNTKLDAIKYKHKVESYKKMKNTGKAFLIVGIPATIGGISLIIKGDRQINNAMNQPYTSTYNSNTGTFTTENNDDEFDKGSRNMMLGALMAYVGVPLTVLGAIFTPTGNRKSKQYQELLDNMSLGAYYFQDKKGFVLKYTF